MNKKITVHSILNGTKGFVTLNEEDNKCDGIVEYEKIDNSTCAITSVKIYDTYNSELNRLIKSAFEDIVESGLIPVPRCEEARIWYENTKSQNTRKETIMEVEPNTADGSKKLRSDDDSGYELFIEYPVRDACKKLTTKGIKTIMSSANKQDAITAEKKEKEGNELYIGPNEHYSIGNGYAWIMIDFNELYPDNKDLVISLNNGEIPINLSDEAKKRFERNCVVNNVPIDQRELVKFYRVVDGNLSRYSRIQDPRFAINSNILIQHNSLSYHGSDYDAVVLRYPIDTNTSVDEIINYYDSLVELFKEKKRIRIV